MHLNKNKCGIMFFNPTSHLKLTKFELNMGSIEGIPIVCEYTYLGVILTKNL
jgi:hypothetical protein